MSTEAANFPPAGGGNGGGNGGSDAPPPSILSHVSLGTNRFEEAVAYGRAFPEFWVQAPCDGQRAQAANGVHVAFLAASPQQVQAFHAAALAAGGTDDGAPGPRPHYGPQYWGCFVRDLDGHKIEAMAWLPAA